MAVLHKDTPLGDSHLKICLDLAAGLARQSQLSADRPANVRLPDNARVLWPLEQLYYVEPQFAGWLSGDKLPEAMHLLHDALTPDLASQLHVQSLRQIHEVRAGFKSYCQPLTLLQERCGILQLDYFT